MSWVALPKGILNMDKGIIKPAMDRNSKDWCEPCGHEHGPLYICEHYSEERKAQKQKDSDNFIKCLNDPEWIKKQLDNGVPQEAITSFRMFAGLED